MTRKNLKRKSKLKDQISSGFVNNKFESSMMLQNGKNYFLNLLIPKPISENIAMTLGEVSTGSPYTFNYKEW